MPQVNLNLDISIWEKIDNILREKDWNKIKFNYDSRDFVPKKKGVYIISLSSSKISKFKPFSKFETPVYVGHSNNLRTRFIDHTHKNESGIYRIHLHDFRNYTSFWYLELDNSSITQLKEYEQSLINLFGTVLNKINSISDDKIKIKSLKETEDD